MIKVYRTEINPTEEQKQKINQTIGVCRYVYNLFVSHNQELNKQGKARKSGYDFSKWLNNSYVPNNPDKSWIKEVSSKSVKQSIMDCHKAYKKFDDMKKKPNYKSYSKRQIEHANRLGKKLTYYDSKGHPKFKKKNKCDVKMYFVKTDSKALIACERHRIKIPTLGWVIIKEKNYIPTNKIISSGTISKIADRYYVCVIVKTDEENTNMKTGSAGIGIDVGIKSLAIVSDGATAKNINKSNRIKKIEKKLKREQKKLSRKYENLKKYKEKEKATRKNIQKQVLTVQKLHQKLTNIRTDYINKTVNDLVKTKPNYITIEDLNISGMMKNKHLSKAISNQKLYEFRLKLNLKCKEKGIELRIVDRFYPSSRLCHNCGHIKKDLKLSDRIYVCDNCEYVADRDYNASLNLRDAKIYKIAQEK